MSQLSADIPLKEPFYFISDTHISTVTGTEQDERRKKVCHILDHISKTGGTLFILGDFFDFCFSCRKYIHPHLQEFTDSLRSLSDKGIAIHYISGNHDYWIRGSLCDYSHIHFYPDELSFTHKGQSFYCTHGDKQVYKKNIYPLARRIMRSRIAIFLLSCLPCRWIYALGEKISSYNRPYAQIKPIENTYISAMQSFLRSKLENGSDIALSGHVHFPYIKQQDGKTIAILGDWIHYSRLGIWEKGTFRLAHYNELI